jgi:hypothetical protein
MSTEPVGLAQRGGVVNKYAAWVAAVVVVGGALFAVTIATSGAVAQESAVDDDRPDVDRSGLLPDVLADLVADGTIDQPQAEAVEAALREAVAQHRPLRRAARRGARAGYRIGRFLADDVIDADELSSLPDDHVLRDPDGPAADFIDDGRLTRDELRTIRTHWNGGRSTDR